MAKRTNNQSSIQNIAVTFIEQLADAVAARLGSLGGSLGGSRGTALAEKPANGRRKRRGAPGRKLDMSCRVEGCKNRSRGPRFHFLCAQHEKSLSAKQKAEVVAAYKKKTAA
jgi:hypothetical protein